MRGVAQKEVEKRRGEDGGECDEKEGTAGKECTTVEATKIRAAATSRRLPVIIYMHRRKIKRERSLCHLNQGLLLASHSFHCLPVLGEHGLQYRVHAHHLAVWLLLLEL